MPSWRRMPSTGKISDGAAILDDWCYSFPAPAFTCHQRPAMTGRGDGSPLPHRPGDVGDADAGAADHVVEPGERLEDALVLLLVGLVVVGAVGRDLAEIAGEVERLDLGKDGAEQPQHRLDV